MKKTSVLSNKYSSENLQKNIVYFEGGNNRFWLYYDRDEAHNDNNDFFVFSQYHVPSKWDLVLQLHMTRNDNKIRNVFQVHWSFIEKSPTLDDYVVAKHSSQFQGRHLIQYEIFESPSSGPTFNELITARGPCILTVSIYITGNFIEIFLFLSCDVLICLIWAKGSYHHRNV